MPTFCTPLWFKVKVGPSGDLSPGLMTPDSASIPPECEVGWHLSLHPTPLLPAPQSRPRAPCRPRIWCWFGS